ncbi:MAG TPA: transposase [Ramlibacter sp.]|nr:transposase [Ramlibacter sp.]
MSNYRRDRTPGATWFFTVVTHGRRPWLCREAPLRALAIAFEQTRERFPYRVIAGVVLPDHLHVVWSHPEGDCDFGKRWSLVKRLTGDLLEAEGGLDSFPCSSHGSRVERTLWQRRFWEHRIRDEVDLQNHVDYINYNPVRHGLVGRAAEWPHSTLQRFIRRGWMSPDWAAGNDACVQAGE